MKTKSTHAAAFARIDALIAKHGPRLANFPPTTRARITGMR